MHLKSVCYSEMTNLSMEASGATDELFELMSTSVNDSFAPFKLENYLWQNSDILVSEGQDYIDSLLVISRRFLLTILALCKLKYLFSTAYRSVGTMFGIIFSIAGGVLIIVAFIFWSKDRMPAERTKLNHCCGFVILG